MSLKIICTEQVGNQLAICLYNLRELMIDPDIDRLKNNMTSKMDPIIRTSDVETMKEYLKALIDFKKIINHFDFFIN